MNKLDACDYIERRITIGLIVSTEFYERIEQHWRGDLIESPELRRVAGWCWEHYRQYNKAPGRDMEQIYLNQLTSQSISKAEAELIGLILTQASEDYETGAVSLNVGYLADETIRYFRGRALSVHTEKMQELLDRNKIEEAERLHTEFAPSGSTPGDANGLFLQRASEIKPEPIEWLWPDRIPIGKLTLIGGECGVGKSLMAVDLAARVSRGWPCPEPGQPRQRIYHPADTLIFAGEDAANDTIVPRLKLAGATLRRVHLPNIFKDERGKVRPWTLADVEALDRSLAEIPEIRLVIIDPTGTFLGGKLDTSRDNQVRAVLAPLADVAAKHRVALVLIHHLNKAGQKDDRRAVERILGSVAFANIVRAVYIVVRDGTAEDRGLFVPAKANLARPMPGIRYQIVGEGGYPRIEWGEVADVDANEALGTSGRKTKLDLALEWLREYLGTGPRPVKQLFSTGRGAGHTEDTIRRAKQVAGVESYKDRNTNGEWWWRLPEEVTVRANSRVRIAQREHTDGSEVPANLGLEREHEDGD